MVRAGERKLAWLLGGVYCACLLAQAQQPEPALARLNESGQIVVAGRATPYLIRHLPVSSFPELPGEFAALLSRRGCLIPQTYEAHRPENVIHGSFERAGSLDWAVLCSESGSGRGTVSLIVFFASAPAKLLVLASGPETERLQAHDRSGVLGFNWGIDPASPERVRQAQAGMAHRPALLGHDAVADSIVDGRIVYHFYARDAWTVLDVPE
jgi:hypothetical protein